MAPDTSPEANRYRIARLEHDMERLEARLEDYPALKHDVTNLTAAAKQLADEFNSLKRAFYTAALTFCGSLLVGALLWQLAQK